jgi:hypothetical protein
VGDFDDAAGDHHAIRRLCDANDHIDEKDRVVREAGRHAPLKYVQASAPRQAARNAGARHADILEFDGQLDELLAGRRLDGGNQLAQLGFQDFILPAGLLPFLRRDRLADASDQDIEIAVGGQGSGNIRPRNGIANESAK